MPLTTPDWLAQHAGSLCPNVLGGWVVYLGEEPQYRVKPVPVEGKFGCSIEQTINGRRLDGTGVFASEEEAVRGGLEALRKALGW
jgi:hypothetical protein